MNDRKKGRKGHKEDKQEGKQNKQEAKQEKLEAKQEKHEAKQNKNEGKQNKQGTAPAGGGQGQVPASPPAPPPPGARVEAFLACARQSLGGVYCTPAREPECTDCSGLVRRCYRQATGREITGDSHEQIKLGMPVARPDVQPGDLLFWDTRNGAEVRGGNTASHVGIASGGNRMLNALSEEFGIRESDLGTDYWMRQVTFLGARRLEF